MISLSHLSPSSGPVAGHTRVPVHALTSTRGSGGVAVDNHRGQRISASAVIYTSGCFTTRLVIRLLVSPPSAQSRVSLPDKCCNAFSHRLLSVVTCLHRVRAPAHPQLHQRLSAVCPMRTSSCLAETRYLSHRVSSRGRSPASYISLSTRKQPTDTGTRRPYVSVCHCRMPATATSFRIY